MAQSDYPKFMCRPGGKEPCWGVLIEPGFASSAEDEAAKLQDGWYLRPDEFPAQDEPLKTPEERVRAKPGRKPKLRDAA